MVEITALDVGMMGVAGSLIGIATTSLFNLMITKNNREKAFNEWRRDKFLALIYEFLEDFKDRTRKNNGDLKQFDPNLITEMAIKNYSSSDQKAIQLCLFMPMGKSKKFIEKYTILKTETAKKTDKMHSSFMSGDYFDYFSTPEDYSQLQEIIELLNSVMEEMK